MIELLTFLHTIQTLLVLHIFLVIRSFRFFHVRDDLGDDPWEDIFKLSPSVAVSEFCEWVQVGIDVYIPHQKYQIKSHLSPWFSAAYAAAIVHRNHFFHLKKTL